MLRPGFPSQSPACLTHSSQSIAFHPPPLHHHTSRTYPRPSFTASSPFIYSHNLYTKPVIKAEALGSDSLGSNTVRSWENTLTSLSLSEMTVVIWPVRCGRWIYTHIYVTSEPTLPVVLW